ncbi:MAG: hypothetical protein IJK04_00310, partial [Kiritimatiellae bacterium]|nr:hypothetical protein [Kiritimatiellia bacterium]
RDGAVEVRIGFASKGYVRKGAPQKSGDVWVLRGTGGVEGAYAAIPRWYEAVGQRPPEGCDRAAMRARVIYSTGMKGPVEQHKRKGLGKGEYDGGFEAKREVLPALAALGANTVWIRPVNGGYNPDDYYCIDPETGTPDDFRDYVARAHAAGLLLSLGFDDFGYVPFFTDADWSLKRGELFRRRVAGGGRQASRT